MLSSGARLERVVAIALAIAMPALADAAKRWIRVGVSRVAMLRYPRERDFVVVTFDQDYRSNSLSHVMRKRQYWVKEGADWKIIYEGSG